MIKILKIGFMLSLVGMLIACGSSTSDEQYVNKAQSYLDKGELKAAAIELKNALRQNPDSTQARWLLGKLHLEMGNVAAAEKELSRAKELGLAEGEVVPLLARALLEQGKITKVLEISRDNLPEDAEVSVLSLQGLGKLMQGEAGDAERLINEALSKNPESPEALEAKARLLVAKMQNDQAREQLSKIFRIDQKYAPAWSVLGDIEQRENKPEKALEAYNNAINFRLNNLSDRLKRALTLVGLNKRAEAQKDVNVLLKKFPLHPGVNYAQGLIFLQDKKLQEAQAAFNLALADRESYPQALYFGAMTNLMLGNLGQARAYAEGFHSRFDKHIPARKLLAMINLSEANYTEVERLLRPVIEAEEEDVVALNLLANALMNLGKMDEAIKLLTKVAELKPDSPGAQMRLGAGLMGAGDQESGMEHVASAIQLNPKFQQADILIVLNHLRQKQFGQALEAAEAYRERNPDSAAPYNLIGRVHLANNKVAEAEKAFDKALSIAPGDPSANHTLAVLAQGNKDYARARDYYHAVLKHHENHLSTLLSLAALDSLEKKDEQMLEHLQLARDTYPKALQPRLLLARHYHFKGQPDKVLEFFVDLEDAQTNHPAVLDIVARSQLARKKFSNAKRTLKKLISKEPRSADAHFLMSQVYAGLGEDKNMRKELETALRYAPDHFAARLAVARKSWLDKDYAAVSKHLQELKKLAVDHPDVLQLEMSLAEQHGDKEEALRLSEKIYQLSPSSASVLTLARQKWQAGDREGSLTLKEQWVSEHAEDVSVRISLASSYIAQSKTDAAIGQYRSVVNNDDENVIALNNLAWYLRDSEPGEALEYARRLNELEPNVTNFMDTLAVVLMKNGEIEEAQRIMNQLLLRAPKDNDIRYHSAMIDMAAGRKSRAEKTLTALLSDASDFPQRQEAEKLLNKIKASN
jgi:putative PEP-CTERM system TPR-repeat lipoprotein